MQWLGNVRTRATRALSLEASQIDPASLIFEGKRVEGFWLTAWLRQRNMPSQLRVTRHVQRLLGGDLKTEIQARLPLKEIARGLEQYASNMTGGKILLLPLTLWQRSPGWHRMRDHYYSGRARHPSCVGVPPAQRDAQR
jgi:hypothetical protein